MIPSLCDRLAMVFFPLLHGWMVRVSREPVQSEHSANVMEGITEQSHAGFLECSCLFATLKGGSVPCSKTLTARSFSFFSYQDTGEAHLICVTGCWTVCCLGGLWNQLLSSKNKGTFWKHAGDDNDYHMRFRMRSESCGAAVTILVFPSLKTNTRIKEKGD